MSTDRSRGIHREVRALWKALKELQRRVEQLESAPSILPPQRSPEAVIAKAESEPATSSSQLFFTRLALACFVLGAALVLRTITRQGWLSPIVGAVFGLSYCGLLLVLPYAFNRLRGGWPHAPMLQLSGALLAPLIVVETVHRSQAMNHAAAAVVLGAFALLGVVLSVLQGFARLAMTVLLVQTIAVVALGVTSQGLVERSAVIVEIVVLALWLAHNRRWDSLRPLIVVPAMLFLAAAVISTAHRTGLTPATTLAPITASVSVWGVLSINHIVRLGLLTRFEHVSFPLATVCCYGLCAFYRPGVAVPAAVAVSLALVVLARGATNPKRRQARVGLALSGALLAALSLPWLDPTGLSLAVLAIVVLRLDATRDLPAAGILSQSLMLAAVVTLLIRGTLLVVPPLTQMPLLAGGALGLIGLSYYRDVLRIRGDEDWMAPVALVGALVVLICTFRALAYLLLPSYSAVAFAQTLAIAVSSTLILLLGRRLGRRSAVNIGLLGVGLLAIRVLLWDIVRVEGVYLVASVLALGLAAMSASLILRYVASPVADLKSSPAVLLSSIEPESSTKSTKGPRATSAVDETSAVRASGEVVPQRGGSESAGDKR